MATGPPRRAPLDRRSRWAVNMGSKSHHNCHVKNVKTGKLLHNKWDLRCQNNTQKYWCLYCLIILLHLWPYLHHTQLHLLPLLVNKLLMWLGSPCFNIFRVLLGGPEEYRWRGGSRDAQGHFRWPTEWGRDGQSNGGGWRRRHLPGENTCDLNTYTDKIQCIHAHILHYHCQEIFWFVWNTNTGFCLHVCLPFQRTHGLFGNRVDSFSTEPDNAQSQQMTNQRPLKFSETQPESPPSSGLVPTTDFFPTMAPKSNINNNAFAEWVPKHTLVYQGD